LPTPPTGEQKQTKRTFDVLPKPANLISYRQFCPRRTAPKFPTTTGGLQVRYFFNVEGNGSIFVDEEGTVLSGLDVAMLQAAVIAAELAQDADEYKGYVVRIADEHGSEIGTVPVVVAAEEGSPVDGSWAPAPRR
jgi:hypothetical protein